MEKDKIIFKNSVVMLLLFTFTSKYRFSYYLPQVESNISLSSEDVKKITLNFFLIISFHDGVTVVVCSKTFFFYVFISIINLSTHTHPFYSIIFLFTKKVYAYTVELITDVNISFYNNDAGSLHTKRRK
jgi:hypothetical protein